MKKKRYILSFLFFISILMLVVPAIPHHHHASGVICVKKDLPTTEQCTTQYDHQQENDACCNSDCQARFHTPPPTMSTDFGQPQHLFVAILFDYLILQNLFQPQEQRIKNSYTYRESLHGANVVRAFGLRAPPCLFV